MCLLSLQWDQSQQNSIITAVTRETIYDETLRIQGCKGIRELDKKRKWWRNNQEISIDESESKETTFHDTTREKKISPRTKWRSSGLLIPETHLAKHDLRGLKKRDTRYVCVFSTNDETEVVGKTLQRGSGLWISLLDKKWTETHSRGSSSKDMFAIFF